MTGRIESWLSWWFVPPPVDVSRFGLVGRLSGARASVERAVASAYFAGVAQGLTAGVGLCLAVCLFLVVFRIRPFRWGGQ